MERKIKKISFEEAKELLDGGNALMFDVREESEYYISHAQGALPFPVDEINEQTASENIPQKSTPVIVYCKTGARAELAAQTLCSLGYENVYDLGSLVDWPYEMGFGAY